jgi:DNA-binding CsgD family transcriptional regulator
VAERISEREAEVLAALGARLSNAQIANRLHISVRTVESHVSSLLRKYGVADRGRWRNWPAPTRGNRAASLACPRPGRRSSAAAPSALPCWPRSRRPGW